MRRRLPLLPLALATLLLAGCGGTKTYSAAKTRTCLVDAKVRVTPVRRTDYVAQSATAGAFTAALTRNDVTISFGQNTDEARRIALGYRRFRGRNIGIEDVLRPDHNAVLLWRAHPDGTDEATIRDCLR